MYWEGLGSIGKYWEGLRSCTLGEAKVAVYCRRLVGQVRQVRQVGQVGQIGQVVVLIAHSTGGKAPKLSQNLPNLPKDSQ